MSSPTEFIAEPEVVVLDLDADSGEAAVRTLHERIVSTSTAVLDASNFLADLLARMRVAQVCISDDVALPHARTDAVVRMVMIVGRTRKPIAFDSQHSGVRLVFLIGTPKDAVTGYLQAVAVLSRILRNPTTREGLLAAADEMEFWALLSGGVAACR